MPPTPRPGIRVLAIVVWQENGYGLACSPSFVERRAWHDGFNGTFPLVVIGANSIFIYSVHQVLQGWLNRAVGVFTLQFTWLGDFAPVAQACTVLLVMWYLCYWLYQRKIFFKL